MGRVSQHRNAVPLEEPRSYSARDRFLICTSCGIRFVWTAWEQAAASEKPQFCPGCRILLPAPDRRRGIIKFYNARRGWGFITQTAGGDVFVHRSGLASGEDHPLREGDLVEFTVQETDRGLQAVDVRRLGV